MLKMTGLFDLASKAFEADIKEVVGNDGKANKTMQILAKSKNIKHSSKIKISLKIRRLEQPTVLSFKTNSVFCMKDVFD